MNQINEDLPVVESPSLQPYPVSFLTDDQLNNLENNYFRKKRRIGGRWTLQEVLQEKQLRLADENDAESVFRVIIGNCRRSPDIRTSYADIHRSLRPNKKWIGHSSQRLVKYAMGNVIRYCVANSLPIVTVLVVQTKTRRLDQDAIDNIYETCLALGCNVGPSAYNFCARQIAPSRQLVRVLH